jgi:hypothetical protein
MAYIVDIPNVPKKVVCKKAVLSKLLKTNLPAK